MQYILYNYLAIILLGKIRFPAWVVNIFKKASTHLHSYALLSLNILPRFLHLSI